MTPVLLAILLAVAALGAGVFAFAGGRDARTAKRVGALTAPRGARAKKLGLSAEDATDRRRKQVADSLKELERKAEAQKKKAKIPLRQVIEQGGLSWSVRNFYIGSAVCGFIIAIGVYANGFAPLLALAAGFAGGAGLPRWFINFKRNRRQKKFLTEFANAIDVIVRGVKSGLPLNDCLRMIGQEAPEPVGAEFRTLVENQKIGITLEDALKRFFERMPLQEVNFFMIVLSIQQKTGGNLAEALSNLSGVLRDRKRLLGKIKALSSEAKASAMILGSLPFAVMILVSLMTPSYIMPLFTEPTGHIMLAGGGFWMLLGVLVMRKMINFKF